MPAPFTFAVWAVRPADFPKWRDRGVTRFITNDPVPEGTTRAAYCSAAADAGGLAMISPSDKPSADAALRGFGGWAQRDEPEGKVPPDVFQAEYFRLRNRGFPVFANFTHQLIDLLEPPGTTPRQYRTYLQSCDIWSFDYHILNRGQTLDAGLPTWERITDGMRMLAGRAKPFFIHVETGPHLPTSLPVTPADLRRMVYKAADLGASGIIYFSIREPRHGFSWDVTPADVAEEMKTIAAEFAGGVPDPPEVAALKQQLAASQSEIERIRSLAQQMLASPDFTTKTRRHEGADG
jgi:hypothetical protein